ncbi:unnamed protein product [Schistosoma bovis]|nr:unnamed protein product [Schistosoma bovis]
MSVISKIRPYCLSFGTGFYIGKSTCYEKSLLFKLQESFPNERKQRLASLLFIAPNKNPHIHSLWLTVDCINNERFTHKIKLLLSVSVTSIQCELKVQRMYLIKLGYYYDLMVYVVIAVRP